MNALLVRLLVAVFGTITLRAADPHLGQPAPEWQLTNWLNSAPLSVKALQGKVVLVRWWTAPQCQFCKATAPALNEFFADYQTQGFTVVGVYHHKVNPPLDPQTVKQFAAQYGFKFPVAIDNDWKALHRWWLDPDGKQWTSVSFLLDRRGVIRHIHPGGQYVKGDKDYAAMKAKIEELLAEK